MLYLRLYPRSPLSSVSSLIEALDSMLDKNIVISSAGSGFSESVQVLINDTLVGVNENTLAFFSTFSTFTPVSFGLPIHR